MKKRINVFWGIILTLAIVTGSIPTFAQAGAPTVISIIPTQGALEGGSSVIITGTNFQSGATVTFGGTAATLITILSSTQISATSPAHTAGLVNVVVTNTDTQSGTLSNGFTYTNNLRSIVQNDETEFDTGTYQGAEYNQGVVIKPSDTGTQGIFVSSALNSGMADRIWDTINWAAQGIRSSNGETPAFTTNLVAQWNFNEASGTAAANASGTCGSSCNMTLINFPNLTGRDVVLGSGWTANNKKWGAGAIMFNANNQRLTSTGTPYISTNWTIEAWINPISAPASGEGGSIVSRLETSSPYRHNFWFEIWNTGSGPTSKLVCGYYNGSINATARSAYAVPLNVWSHVACVKEGDTPHLYLNGIEMALEANTFSGNPGDYGQLIIGDDWDDMQARNFKGTLDTIRIYSKTLSPSEIASNYQSGSIELQTRTGNTATPDATWDTWKPVTSEASVENFDQQYLYPTTTSGLVSYFPMDELSGTTVADVKGSNGLTATGTKIVDGKFRKARSFNGTSDYLYKNSVGAFTVSHIGVWFKSSTDVSASTPCMGLAQAKYVNNDYWFGVGIGSCTSLLTDETITLTENDSNLHAYRTAVINVSISKDTWHKLDVAWNSGSGRYDIYLDGIAQTVSSSAHGHVPLFSDPNVFNIGAENGTSGMYRFFSGIIDEVRFDNESYSSAGINRDYLEGVQSLDIPMLGESFSTSIKSEGNGSLKMTLGMPRSDANTVGLWHLEETGGTGAYIKDDTQNAHDLTPSASQSADGIFGKGRYFSATAGDRLTTPDSADWDLSGSNGSLEYWIKPTAATVALLVSQTHSNADGNWATYVYNTGSVCIGISGSTELCSATGLLTQNVWHHVAFIKSSGTTYIYVDGIQRTSGTGTYWNNSTRALAIGARGEGTLPFTGYIDEVRFTKNIARTADEIANAYRMGRDTYINRSISSTDLTSKNKIPFYIAADRPGKFLEITAGESSFVNGQCDTDTKNLWHFDEATGTGAYLKDSCGTSHGTSSGTTQTDGKIGKARNFNGTSDYASTNVNLSSTNVITVDFWMNWSNFTNNNMIAMELSTNYNNVNNGFVIAPNNSSTSSFSIGVHETAGWNTTEITRPGPGWHHYAFIINKGASASQVITPYVDGIAVSYTKGNSTAMSGNFGNLPLYFMSRAGTTNIAAGTIDEIRISSAARSAANIRATYERGLRTHPVTIDFAAKLDSGNLITNSGDTGFTTDGIPYGLTQKASGLYPDDKIIIRENYNGTEYFAQGTVSSVNASTGDVTVIAWDAGSTFPSIGYTTNAAVMKWQRDYWDITKITTGTGTGDAQNQRDAITNLTLRTTDGTEGRTIYLDDMKSSSGYLTDGTILNEISSLAGQYLQYRAIMTSDSGDLSPTLASVTATYQQNLPTINSNITPSGGPLSGGTRVTVTGTNILSGTTLRFGDSAGINIIITGTTQISAETPLTTQPGTVDIIVTNAEGSATQQNIFTYYAAPTITGILPTGGYTTGGQTLTISGTNFYDGETDATVTIGGNTCANPTINSTTEITCTVPQGTAGSKDIVVTTPSGASTGGSGLYTYLEPPIPGETQGSGQNYTQEIICPSDPVFSISKAPSTITWDRKTVSDTLQQSYDTKVSDDTPLPFDNVLTVTDTRSGGADECPLNQRGLIVQAQISSPLSNGIVTIPSTNLRIITSNEGLTTNDNNQAAYSVPSGTGNLHDVTAPVLYDDFAHSAATVWNKFRSPEAYIYAATTGGTASNPSGTPGNGTDLNNRLNGIVNLLETHTSHNAEISTGISIKLTIPGNQDPGIYIGTITYTLMAQ